MPPSRSFPGLHGRVRTKSKRTRLCPVCGTSMRKNGRTAAGSQRWKCMACMLGATAPRRDAARAADLRVFLGWLLSGRTQGHGYGLFVFNVFRRCEVVTKCWTPWAGRSRHYGEVFARAA